MRRENVFIYFHIRRRRKNRMRARESLRGCRGKTGGNGDLISKKGVLNKRKDILKTLFEI